MCTDDAIQEVKFALKTKVYDAAQEGTNHGRGNPVCRCDRLAHIPENTEGYQAESSDQLDRRIKAYVAKGLLSRLA